MKNFSNKKAIVSFFSVFVLLFLNQACSKKGDGQKLEAGQIIPVLFNPDKFPPLDSFVAEITVIPLETNENSLLREHPQGIKVHKGLIYINNQRQELYVFDKNGKFIRQIGSRGQGPGEFVEVSDFIFTQDGTIELLDLNKIESYSLEGKHIRTVKRFDFLETDIYYPRNFCKSFSSGYFFWGGMNYTGQRPDPTNLLYRLNSDMQIEAAFFDTKFGDGGTRDRFSFYKDRVLFSCSPVDYNIYQIEPNDSISIRYTFDFGNYGIKIGKNDDRTTVPADVRDDYVRDISHFHETDLFLVFGFNYKSRTYILLYSKATGQIFIKPYHPSANGKEMRLYSIHAIYNDLLVAFVQVSWLKMDLERMSPENIKKWGLEKYKKLDDEDNPVLILYKTKF